MCSQTESASGGKICVTSDGNTLNSSVDPRFGRCRYFIIAELDTLAFEAVQNPHVEAMGGAGVQSGQLVAEKKVKAVLTGNIGPNAFHTLQAAGIEIYTGASGTVTQAIEHYKNGKLKIASNPSVSSKSGTPGKKT